MKFIPTLAGELSGSLGGTVASRNKGGAYFRRRAVPTNPNTLLQQQRRSALAAASSYWRLLTTTQQLQWSNFGLQVGTVDRIGQAIPLSGQQAFVRTATLAATLLGTTPDTYADAPAIFELAPPVTVPNPPPSLTLDAGQVTLSLPLASIVGELAVYGLFVSSPLPSPLTYYKGPYQFAGVTNVTAAVANAVWTLDPTDFSIPIAPGQIRGIRVIGLTDSGRPSPPTLALVGTNVIP